jgi:hypothetical protein
MLISRGALRIKFNTERLTTALNATKLFFKPALALIDGRKV